MKEKNSITQKNDKIEPTKLPSFSVIPNLSFFSQNSNTLEFDGIEKKLIRYRREDMRIGKKVTNIPSLRYVIYSLTHLNELLSALEISKEYHLRNNRYNTNKIRYLVTTEMQLVFAKEGTPNESVPAHYRMTCEEKENAQCLAAGNIYVKKIGNHFQITKINHKSGDFKPELESMKWALAILLAHEASLPENFLPDTLVIEKINSSGGGETSYSKTKKDLTDDLADHIA
ncbi:MAG: hypothetical protein K2X39_09350, partial [Silvanigrellaceae bacterium]|nr:hypothetical protein [Silvanigrellaceae bacterium]